MNFDPGQPVEQRKAPDLWRLPKVLDVRSHYRWFDPPKRITAAGVDRDIREGVEVEIRVSEPFTIRALGPVLWVGDEPLTIAEAHGKEVYRFLSTNPEALKAGAPISLSWNSRAAARERTEYKYEPPAR